MPDEVIYLLHARYFAAGMTSMPVPPVVPAFELDLMTYEPPRWFSPVPPGWPAVLAVGALLGVPWLVDPVLAGISVFLAYALLKHVYPLRTARYATALLAASPWFLFLGMSFMTHMLTLTCALCGFQLQQSAIVRRRSIDTSVTTRDDTCHGRAGGYRNYLCTSLRRIEGMG